MSHAAGVGPPFPREVVRAMLLLRANTLALGHSGCRPLDRRPAPRLPRASGSIRSCPSRGASAHPATWPRWRTWRCRSSGAARWSSTAHVVPALIALRETGLEPLVLEAKEGLALLNGTQLMSAIGALLLADADRLARTATVAAAHERRGAPRHGRRLRRRVPAGPPASRARSRSPAELRHLLRDSAVQRSHHGWLAQGPGPVLAALRAAGPRRRPGRPRPPPAGPRHRAELGHGQPARLRRRRRRRRRTRRRPAADGSSAAATSTASRSRSPSTSPSSPSPSSARSASAGPRCSWTRGSTAGCPRSWRRRAASIRG